MHAPNDVHSVLRANGLKVTPQRDLVVRILQDNTSHPTAESIYLAARGEQSSISLKTVYQVLHDLADIGEIQVLDLGTGAIRFDPNTSGHHHLVCTGCGTAHDVSLDTRNLVVPSQQSHGFVVEAADVVFRGRCPGCQSPHPCDPSTH